MRNFILMFVFLFGLVGTAQEKTDPIDFSDEVVAVQSDYDIGKTTILSFSEIQPTGLMEAIQPSGIVNNLNYVTADVFPKQEWKAPDDFDLLTLLNTAYKMELIETKAKIYEDIIYELYESSPLETQIKYSNLVETIGAQNGDCGECVYYDCRHGSNHCCVYRRCPPYE